MVHKTSRGTTSDTRYMGLIRFLDFEFVPSMPTRSSRKLRCALLYDFHKFSEVDIQKDVNHDDKKFSEIVIDLC